MQSTFIHPKLLTNTHKDIFFNTLSERAPEYPKVFKVGSMDKRDETYVHEGSFGLFSENTEGNSINLDQLTEGPTVTFTARRFDKGYYVTHELVRDNLYKAQMGYGKGGDAMGLARALRETEENDCASVLNGAFANTGYDGVALFSDSHPLISSTSLGDNLTTGSLSDATLKAAITLLRKTPSEANYPVDLRPARLIVPIDLEFTARTILMSGGPAGVISNDKNVLPMLDLVVMAKLSSATAWFVQSDDEKNLVFLRRDPTMFGSQEVQGKLDVFMYAMSRWDTGYTGWRGLVGSAG